MKIKVLYFAQMKQRRGLGSEIVDTSCSTISSLYQELDTKHQLGIPLSQLKAARNEVFCESNSALQEDDTVAFLPPMSGG